MEINQVNFAKIKSGNLHTAVKLAVTKTSPNFLEFAADQNVLSMKFGTIPTESKEFYDAFDGGKIKNITFYAQTEANKQHPNLAYYFRDYGTVDRIKQFLNGAGVSMNEPLMFVANIGPYKRAAFNAKEAKPHIFEVDYNNQGVITTYPNFSTYLNYYFGK